MGILGHIYTSMVVIHYVIHLIQSFIDCIRQCVCVLKSSHSPWMRLEEDVVKANITARIKSCYRHFEVWSL